ncbi:hypothetical protein GX586_02045 [bacterium]|nr:hypothetical protein [bacterium]
MHLTTKPDLERVKDVWNHFWHGEIVKRPPVIASVTRPGCEPAWPGHLRYHRAMTGNYQAILDDIDRWIDSTVFLAEYIPHFDPSHGPDQYAAFLGGMLEYSDDSPETNWIKPWVKDGGWNEVLPLDIHDDNPVWKSMLALSRLLAAHAKGRYLVGVADLHSNMDALSAMRGAEALCMDLLDCPGLVAQAMRDVRATYPRVYNALYDAGGMSGATGTTGWIPFWCAGKFATIQCDFLCMISPAFSRKFVLPALEEEASFLDHCILHFDGPGALPHLDDILSIKRIDAIQWVPGAGRPPMHTWTDVLTRCQNAGKALQIYGVTPDEVKQLHRVLAPDKTVYCVDVKTVEEEEELERWLEANT